MEEKNKTYTVSDFYRYHSGNMPANEMHALEKAALEDPFLADALEGYAYSTSPEKDIAELREQFAEKRKSKKVFFISSVIQNKWWSVAALFIVILGVGYLFYRTNNNNATEDSLAKNDIKKSPAKVESPIPALKNTSPSNKDVAFENQKLSKFPEKNKTALPKTNTVIEHEKISTNLPPKSAEASALLSTTENTYSTDSFRFSESQNEKDTSKQYVFKGKVTDETGTPIPNVSITNQHLGIITDANGEFSFASADSNTKVIASAVGYSSKDFLLKEGVEPIIKMNRNDANLTEVVVTAYGVKRKKTLPSSKNLQGRVAGAGIKKPGIQPFPVNEKFIQYVQQNLLPVYDSSNQHLTGEVQLSFNINKKGRPRNIKVLGSTCKECEQQAIHLLENGPDWIPNKNETGTVEIKF